MSEQGNNFPASGTTGPDSISQPLSLSDRVRSLRLPDKPSGPPPRLAWLPWALGALLAVTAVALGVMFHDIASLKDDLQDIRKAVSGSVKDSLVGRQGKAETKDAAGQGELLHESKGYIIPISLIQVSPLIGGRVMELYIEEGKKVEEEEVLAVLEKVDYKSDFDRTKALIKAAEHRLAELTKYRDREIEQAKAELEDTKAQRDQLFLDFQRNQDLKNRSAVSPRDYEQAQSSYLSMDRRMARLKLAYELMIKGPRDERIASIEAEKQQAIADWKKAEWRLENCVVKAPTAGIILTKKAEKGNMVNPSAFSNGLSASLCEMADLKKLEVDLAIAERDIAKIFKYQACEVRAEAFLDRPYKGYVSRIMPQADRGKGAVPVRVVILGITSEEEGRYLRPEMGAYVNFFNKKIADKFIKLPK